MQCKAARLPGAQRGGRTLRQSKMCACLMEDAGLPLPEPELRSQHEGAAAERLALVVDEHERQFVSAML